MRISRLLLATLLPLAVATAQQGVTLTISLPKTVFYMGETIPLQLAFTAIEPGAYTAGTNMYDRGGRLEYLEVFNVDPAGGVEDPLRGLPGEGYGGGGLSGGPVTLSAKPFTVERDLNEWVHFTQTGAFRITVVSHRASPLRKPLQPLEIASNTLAIEVLPAPDEWVKEQIAGAVRILEASDATFNDRQRASRTLRFLNTPESATAALLHFDEGSHDLQVAVLGSPNRRQRLAVMEQRLVAPDQPVGYRYLYTLSNLAAMVASGGLEVPAWEEKRAHYVTQLEAALAHKQPEPRAVSLDTLLNLAPPADPEPAWLHSAVELVVRDFAALPLRTQSQLLQSRWKVLKGPAMLPILRDLYAHSSGRDLTAVVVHRLLELAPQEGRRILLDEIRRPGSQLPFDLLASLPDRTLPELDELFAERLDDWLIVRYASGAIVERVEQAYERRAADFARQKLPQCATPLAFYFLKYDPEYGERELRHSFSAEAGYLACYDIGRNFPGPWAMSPALERLAIEMLSSPSVPVKNGAATVLGKYGSPAAQEPLWRTLEFFHSYWKDREADLKGDAGREGIDFERTLRIALAQGSAWLLSNAGLTRLQSLCSSDWCRQEVAAWLQAAKPPIHISITNSGDNLHFTLAQYEIQSEEDLRRRLAQFPPGIEFQLQSYAGDVARERLRQTVIAAGHVAQ